MAWYYLLLAGVLEVAWAIGLKYTHGLTRLWPSVFTILASIASFFFLARATWDERLPIGNAYAIWTGIGAAGTALAGIVLFREPANPARCACIVLIIVGILGLELTTPAAESLPPPAGEETRPTP